MSEYTTREILDMIEANGGPEGLDLSERNLLFIDLSCETIRRELDRVREENPAAEPPWWDDGWLGIRLDNCNMEDANLGGAHLERGYLASIRLQGADLRSTKLNEAHLADFRHLVDFNCRRRSRMLRTARKRRSQRRKPRHRGPFGPQNAS